MDTPSDLREFIRSTLTGDGHVREFIGEAWYEYAHQPKSISPPYGIIKLGNATRYQIRDGGTQPFQLWVHDRPGDYYLIDQVLWAAKDALESAQPKGIFLQFTWVDISPDLLDDVQDHIVRWSRFNAAMTWRPPE